MLHNKVIPPVFKDEAHLLMSQHNLFLYQLEYFVELFKFSLQSEKFSNEMCSYYENKGSLEVLLHIVCVYFVLIWLNTRKPCT